MQNVHKSQDGIFVLNTHIAGFLKLREHTVISISTFFKNLILSLLPPGILLGKVKGV